jgi:hypothetical protein
MPPCKRSICKQIVILLVIAISEQPVNVGAMVTADIGDEERDEFGWDVIKRRVGHMYALRHHASGRGGESSPAIGTKSCASLAALSALCHSPYCHSALLPNDLLPNNPLPLRPAATRPAVTRPTASNLQPLVVR